MLTRDEIDAIGDRFGYFKYGDAQGDQRAAFARAVEAAAYDAAIKACEEQKGRQTWIQSWKDHNYGCDSCADAIRALIQEQPK